MFFKKKVFAEVQVQVKASPCDHKWKDFGITMLTNHLEHNQFKVVLFKHYACIWCKEHKRVKLVEDWCENKEELSKKEKEIEKLHNVEYDSIVMERIADFQLLDREYLEIARQRFPGRGY